MTMKANKIVFNLLTVFVAGGLIFYSCKKESSSTAAKPSLTGSQTLQVQNADAQDAIADKTEEDIDSKLDELQNNNYVAGNMKALADGLTDTVVITVNHPDTTFYPKVVTLTFYNLRDSSAFENITKNGQIVVTVSRPDMNHPRLISRIINFNHFSVTTDSTIFTINGIRTVNRQKVSLKYKGLQSIRLAVTDNISAATNWAVVSTGKTDTLKFTRIVNKVRTAVTHFRNVIYVPNDLLHFRFRHIFSTDTLTYNGTVTGINEAGATYSKTISSPLTITEYRGSLVISSGTIAYVSGANSYQITFEQDPAHKHYTLVTVTNNQTGTTKSFDRRFGRLFRRWW
jgi:hypothetical protein